MCRFNLGGDYNGNGRTSCRAILDRKISIDQIAPHLVYYEKLIILFKKMVKYTSNSQREFIKLLNSLF